MITPGEFIKVIVLGVTLYLVHRHGKRKHSAKEIDIIRSLRR